MDSVCLTVKQETLLETSQERNMEPEALQDMESVWLPLHDQNMEQDMESVSLPVKQEPVHDQNMEQELQQNLLEPDVTVKVECGDEHSISLKEWPDLSGSLLPGKDRVERQTCDPVNSSRPSAQPNGTAEGHNSAVPSTPSVITILTTECKQNNKILSLKHWMGDSTSHATQLVSNTFMNDTSVPRYSRKLTNNKSEYCGRQLTPHGHIADLETDYKCQYCGKCFGHLRNLKIHFKIHSGIKNYKCEECGKCFAESGNLTKHVRTHSGAKDYKCEACGKCFTRCGNLRSHQRSHFGIKNYKCEECGQCFTQRSSLSIHSRIHSGVKDYKCDECGRCFTQRGHLTTHSRIHSGIKDNKCEECGKCFSESGDLRKHLRIHSGVKDYKCEACGRCFTQRGHLKSHIKRLHSN